MYNLKELIDRPEYAWLNEYKDRLCFICLSGSRGYGLEKEDSDYDFRGVMMPTKDELIGLNHFEQRLDDNTDTCIYEFNKFIKLAMENNPNVIELLGCDQYLIFNEVGDKLLDSVGLFLSKRCYKTFKGYATAQLRKIENYLAETEYTQEEKNKHIAQTMEVTITKLEETNKLFKDGSFKVNLTRNGVNISCNIENEPIALVRAALNDLLTIEKTYSKLGQRNTKKTEAQLNKHICHLFRLILTCLDILEKHQMITNRSIDRNYLMAIRNGKYLIDGKLTEDFKKDLDALENKLDEAFNNSCLQEKCNFKELNKFVTEVNSKIITDTVNQYKEPLEIIMV